MVSAYANAAGRPSPIEEGTAAWYRTLADFLVDKIRSFRLSMSQVRNRSRGSFWCTALPMLVAAVANQADAQCSTFGGNAQHTAIFAAPAKRLNRVRWSTAVTTGQIVHYAAPLITASNTALVPITLIGGFNIKAFDAVTGRLKYTLATDYVPYGSGDSLAAYEPVIALGPAGPRLYYPGAGGTVYYVDGIDSDSPSPPVQECFYTDLATYKTNASVFNSSVWIVSPLTADTNGDLFFSFRVGNVPAPLTTNQGGIARIDALGISTFVLATNAAVDARSIQPANDSAPTLSSSFDTLYVGLTGIPYLVGLDATTLATKYRRLLLNPSGGGQCVVLDQSSSSPMVGPDGDIYFGVLGAPYDVRGWLLHFSADLQVEKLPGAFDWDQTPGVAPSGMVPSYSGNDPLSQISSVHADSMGGSALLRGLDEHG